jgi:sugar lactone lactonase YvrE
LLVLSGGLAFGQGLTPDAAIPFGSIDLGSSASDTVQFKGPAGGLTIGSITAVTEGATAKDFAVAPTANGCSGTVSATDICFIKITFTPTQIGRRLGSLVITNSSGGVVNSIPLSGIGVGPQFVFAPSRAITTSTATTLSPAITTFTAGAAVQDGNGNLFFTDVQNGRILERSSTGVFSEVTALPVSATSGLTIDGAGNLYVSSGNSVFIIPFGTTTASVLNVGVTLTAPAGLAMDNVGDLYIADSGNGNLYQFTLGTPPASPITLIGASLNAPTGIAIDDSNNLFIADSGNNRIVEAPLSSFAAQAVSIASTLTNPTGVALDAAGTLYIANTGGNNVIEDTSPTTNTGVQFVLTDPALTLDTPSGIVIEGTGNLVITDTTRGLIFIPRSTPFVDFPTPTVVGDLDTTDDPKHLTVQGTGNIASTLIASTTDANPSISLTSGAAAFLLDPTSGTCPILNAGTAVAPADTFTIGQVCTYAIDFQPTVVGPNRANLVLTTSAAGGALTSTGTAKLFGIGLATVTHFSLQAVTIPATNPTTVNLGGSVELILTALQANGTTSTDYVGTVTFTTTDANGVYLSGGGTGTNTTTFALTAADNGVLIIPEATGLELNALGVFTAGASGTNCPPAANCTATSNDIFVTDEPSTLTLTSSINPSQINQQTIFTLHVATTGTVAPGGTVTFFSDGVQIGSPVTLGSNGSASIPDSFAVAGSYAITATYVSNTNTQGGTASLTQIVGTATAVVLTSSVNPSLVNQSTTLTATVAALSSPTGTVTFKSNGAIIGTGTTTGGVATLITSFSTAGTYDLIAVYGGNTNDQAATSNTVIQVVLNAATVSLTSSVNPILLDNPTILTATLTSTGPTPTGTVSFFDGGTPIGAGTLVNGTVSISASFVYAGTHTITASYSGDTVTAPANSLALSQTVADFTLTVASGGSSTSSAIAGGAASYSLVVTPVITTTLPSAVSLTVTGLPAGATDALTTTAIAAGSSATPVTLTVTAAQILAAIHSAPPPAHRSPVRYAPIALALIALPLAWFRRRKRFGSLLASLCLLFALTGGLTGCISDPATGYYGQTPKTYNLTVTATSGNLVRSVYLTLTVQ